MSSRPQKQQQNQQHGQQKLSGGASQQQHPNVAALATQPATAALAAAAAARNSTTSPSTIPMAPYPPMVVEHRFPSSTTNIGGISRSMSPATAAAAAEVTSAAAASAAAASAAGSTMQRPMSHASMPGSLIMVKQQQHQDSPSSGSTRPTAAIPHSISGSTHSLPLPSQQQLQQQQQSSASEEGRTASTSNKQPRVTGMCRIRFCHGNHVATINNAPIDHVSPSVAAVVVGRNHSSSLTGGGDDVAGGGASSSTRMLLDHQDSSGQISNSSAAYLAPPGAAAGPGVVAPTTPRPPVRKVGPILLELQRLELNEDHPAQHDVDTDCGGGDNNRELFRLRTVARSRGNPSLGTSISSTCLDVMAAGTSKTTTIPSPCATGLTTGALCIHTFSSPNNDDGGGNSLNSNPVPVNLPHDHQDAFLEYSCNIDYFHTPRNNRPATAVAWQPHKFSVAVAWGSRTTSEHHHHAATTAAVSASMGAAAAAGAAGGVGKVLATSGSTPSLKHHHRGGIAGAVGGVKTSSSGLGRVGAAGGQPVDRDYGCFVWDVSQSTAATAYGGSSSSSPPLDHKRTGSSLSAPPAGAVPIAKLAHQSGVASLAWVLDSSPTLAVGGQIRNVQIYDLRVSGQTAPPITFYAHNLGVHGIQADPHRPHLFATFCSVHKEPVKIWDARRVDSHVSEIKVGSSMEDGSMPTGVSAIQWSTSQPGSLTIAVGDAIYDYDTLTSPSRPIHKGTVYARSPISDFCLYRQEKQADDKKNNDDDLLSVLYPRRTLVVHSDRSIHDMAMHRLAPLAVSRRDGRLVHGLGRTLWVGPTNQGPAAMESLEISADEDISATMMRRARCLHDSKYSMDTKANIKMLAEDGIVASDSDSTHQSVPTRDALLRLWSWVERVESLCAESWQDDSCWDGAWNWPAKGLTDAGAIALLRMDTAGDKEEFCEALSCTTYHSAGRSAAMTSCGWVGKFDLLNVISECEVLGEYERAAALAVWHADIGAAVEALQRGATFIRTKSSEGKDAHLSTQYAETLELVALCIAGYRGGDPNSPSSSIWRRACANLLQRSDLSVKNRSMSRVAYMTGLLKFLMSLGSDNGYQEVLFDKFLSLCDRAAFACRFLERDKLQQFLAKCISDCKESGNIEGMTITGIEKEGMKILQSYVDRYADVQTAALVTSRVILPQSWVDERRISAEWLGAYRGLLNTWQMWQSRAMFDVDRAELLRQIKARQIAAENANAASGPGGAGRIMSGNFAAGRRSAPPGRKPSRQQAFDPDVQAAVPAQIDARCNYCSAPLGLRQKDNTASQWLSKMKPVLSCCAQCRKPLPRCAICMLSLGTLNPYTELTKERSRPARPHSSSGKQSPDDYLSTMANLPFAEWPSWCLKCRHVGHTHHLVGWFAKHDVCPVSGCTCRCQFDGIQKLNRPALSLDKRCVRRPDEAATTTDEVASPHAGSS